MWMKSKHTILHGCGTRCMLYFVSTVLRVRSTWCQLMIMAWRDTEEWLNVEFCDEVRIVEEKGRDGQEDENDVKDTSRCEKSGIWLAWVRWDALTYLLIHTGLRLIPAISGWLNDSHTIFFQVPFSHNDLSHLLSALSFKFSTLPSPKNTKLSYPSLSIYAMIKSSRHVQHTPSRAYTDCWIQCIMHLPKTDRLPLPPSLSSVGRSSCTQLPRFRLLPVNQWVESHLP